MEIFDSIYNVKSLTEWILLIEHGMQGYAIESWQVLLVIFVNNLFQKAFSYLCSAFSIAIYLRVTRHNGDKLDKVSVCTFFKRKKGEKNRNNNVCQSGVLEISGREAAVPGQQSFNLELRALEEMLNSLPES